MWVCAHDYTYIYIYTCVWGFGCVLPVRSASACVFDEGSTVPVVLLQDNVCQAPSIWHVFDVEIQGAKAQPASVRSPAGHIYHCACAYMCVWVCVTGREWERERQRARWGETENTESHKPQQAPKVTTASMFFNYPSTREATVCGPNISCAKGTADSAAKRKQYCA